MRGSFFTPQNAPDSLGIGSQNNRPLSCTSITQRAIVFAARGIFLAVADSPAIIKRLAAGVVEEFLFQERADIASVVEGLNV